MESSQFVGGQILSQLQSAGQLASGYSVSFPTYSITVGSDHALGMVSVLELMQGGFPSRAQFSELYHT